MNGSELQLSSNAPGAVPQLSSATSVEQTRAIAETQAAMFVAMSRPRCETTGFNKTIQACKRKSLASTAMYAYRRGGTLVEGPSIRLAEVIARAEHVNENETPFYVN